MAHRYRAILVASALGLVSATAIAQSGDSAVAQALFDQAKLLIADGHVAEACPKLEESERLDSRSGTLINLASCYEQTGRLASAWSTYIEAATSASATGNADREAVARARAVALAPRLSKLTIDVAEAVKALPGLEIARDGVNVREPEWGLALPSDAGPHEVTAKAPGYQSFQASVTVTGEATGATVSVPMLVAEPKPALPGTPSMPAPTAPPPPAIPPSAAHSLGTQRTAALVAGGVGMVGVGLGSVLGLMSKSKHDEAVTKCRGAFCDDQTSQDASDAARRDGNASTVMMIVGGAGLVAGAALWLTAPPRQSGEAVAQVGFGLGTLQLKGAF